MERSRHQVGVYATPDNRSKDAQAEDCGRPEPLLYLIVCGNGDLDSTHSLYCTPKGARSLAIALLQAADAREKLQRFDSRVLTFNSR